MRVVPASSFALAVAATLSLILNASAEESHPARMLVVLLVLAAFHLGIHRRLAFSREWLLYLALACYMGLSMLWTTDRALAADTMLLVLNFLIALMLFGALGRYHETAAVLGGMLTGFLVGAARYDLVSGFPFRYPEEFSYNTIAGMYLFGLFLTVLAGLYWRRALPSIMLASVLMLHIMITTSIKTNLGVVLGIVALGFVYSEKFLAAARRAAIPLAIIAGSGAYFVLSNPPLFDRATAGFERVSAGAGILLAREDVEGVTQFGAREDWKDQGLQGWLTNPVFGAGVEEFRHDHGITSHSTPIDLMYNAGLIGLALFYCMPVSIGWRMWRGRRVADRAWQSVFFAMLVCYSFITLSATMYYDLFLAAFVGLTAAMVGRPSRESRIEDGG